MMSVTHLTIAAAATQFILGETSVPLLLLSSLGSLLPDLDTSKSLLGRMPILNGLSRWIEARYPHRTLTHCLWTSVGLVAACLPLYYFYDWRYWLVIPLAHAIAAVSDTHTPEGVCLFWPLPHRAYFTSNPRLRVRTGSKAEIWLLAAFVAINLLVADINLGGGLWLWFSNALGTSDSVERVFNAYGSTNHIWVNFQGVRASDRAAVKQDFFLVDVRGGKLVLQDANGLYRSDEHLLPERLRAEARANASIQNLIVRWADEELLPKLVQLHEAHPEAAIYLTGSLQVEAAEDWVIANPPGQLPVLSLTGTTLNLDSCPVAELGRLATDQWVTGQVIARIIYPQPEF